MCTQAGVGPDSAHPCEQVPSSNEGHLMVPSFSVMGSWSWSHLPAPSMGEGKGLSSMKGGALFTLVVSLLCVNETLFLLGV